MAEKVIYLDKIGVCLECGDTSRQTRLSTDHFYPRFILKRPYGFNKQNHPLRNVVICRENTFRLCRKDHDRVDPAKFEAFCVDDEQGEYEPAALVEFLMRNYPVTEHSVYRPLQLRYMISINKRFNETVQGLNGELPKTLVERYRDAGRLALEWNRKLEILSAPIWKLAPENEETPAPQIDFALARI